MFYSPSICCGCMSVFSDLRLISPMKYNITVNKSLGWNELWKERATCQQVLFLYTIIPCSIMWKSLFQFWNIYNQLHTIYNWIPAYNWPMPHALSFAIDIIVLCRVTREVLSFASTTTAGLCTVFRAGESDALCLWSRASTHVCRHKENGSIRWYDRRRNVEDDRCINNSYLLNQQTSK